MNYLAQEELEYEFNAQFDYVHEAYAATALDPLIEGYGDVCQNYEAEGLTPPTFEEFKAELNAPRIAPPAGWGAVSEMDCPF